MQMNPMGAWVSLWGWFPLSLAGAAWPNGFARRFLVGGRRSVQLQEALLAWGLFSCRCTAFPVGRARLPAGFLPCWTAGRGGEGSPCCGGGDRGCFSLGVV